jgi:predicted dehydrogenase
MGSIHARVLHELGYDTATVDPDPAKGADHATISEARISVGHLSHLNFDIACVAAPIPHLADAAFQLAGIPKLLIEKPMASTAQEAAMLAAYLDKAGSSVCVGYVERYNPQVRALHARLREQGWPKRDTLSVTFTRWSDRPSVDIGLDLAIHDIDLARHLGLWCEGTTFDTRDNRPEKRRAIDISRGDDRVTHHIAYVDLMAHNTSPVHALWHAFLTGQPHPTAQDAIGNLQDLEAMEAHQREQRAAVAA